MGEAAVKEGSAKEAFPRIDPSFLGKVPPPKPLIELLEAELELFGNREDDPAFMPPGPAVAEDLMLLTCPLTLPVPLIEVLPVAEAGRRGESAEVVLCLPAWLILVFEAEKEASALIGDFAPPPARVRVGNILPDKEGVGRADTLAVLIVRVRGAIIPLVAPTGVIDVVLARLTEVALSPRAREEVLVLCLSVLEVFRPLLTGVRVADPLLLAPESESDEVLARCLRVRVMPALLVTVVEVRLVIDDAGGDRASIACEEVDDICR